tara:strand:+ start:509 stop:640 length:132 start_codon:yes stop_codon:yes gene_type:complete
MDTCLRRYDKNGSLPALVEAEWTLLRDDVSRPGAKKAGDYCFA